jgi:sulfur-oxidizing protein SoxY
MRPTTTRRVVRLAAAAAMAGLMWSLPAAADRPEEIDPWPILHEQVFQSRDIAVDSVVGLEAPDRAEDAALTPVTIRIPAAHAADVKKLTLVIDKNPMPVVAEFAFGPAAGNGDRMISTRVRVDMYSNVRAVAEMADGSLHMALKFAKAAGGCSAPALKDPDAVLAEIGRMQIKTMGDAGPGMREGLLMIKHPQYSGLQKNQLTGFWILAKYITNMEVKRGGETVFTMTGGISISEDPNIRFTYAPAADETIEVTAKDVDGRVMTGASVPKGS